MERGFKSRCEAMARSLRLELGLQPVAPLTASDVADYLGVPLWSVSDIGLGGGDLQQLLEIDPDSWSAITVAAFGREVIIVNPNHRGGRHSSDVMHELAHLILGHEPSKLFIMSDAEQSLRGYDQSSEEEANWLAGALLLPRVVLVHIKSSRMSLTQACEKYKVSEHMLAFRMNATGVARQFARVR